MNIANISLADFFNWLDIPLQIHLELFGIDFSILQVAGLLEYIGLLISFCYLYLEFKQKNAMWILSILCSLTYICIYIHAKLYADMSFSLFNICISVWGLLQWRKKLRGEAANNSMKSASDTAQTSSADASKAKKTQIEYRRFTSSEWVQVLCVMVVVYLVIYFLLRALTDSPLPAKDAFNTTMNIVGTWVLGRKVIEVWGFWFVANIFSVYLYFLRGLYPTMGLYLFYTIASVYGFWKWKKQGIEVKSTKA